VHRALCFDCSAQGVYVGGSRLLLLLLLLLLVWVCFPGHDSTDHSPPTSPSPTGIGTRCVMVGDPNQLPATVFSEDARKRGYSRSLFERLVRTGHRYTMLDTQCVTG
jgi:hypothetical protein